MRLLAIGYPLPSPEIDNYNVLTAPSFFDYDAVFVDPLNFTAMAARVAEGEQFEAFDGRPVVNAATSASAMSAAELLQRRADETRQFLDAGGTIVVTGRPNATQAGIVGFEGCDRYSWLPAPAGMTWGRPHLRAAEGRTLRIAAEDHPFASFLRDFRPHLVYRAVFDARNPAFAAAAKVVARGGSDTPIAVQFEVLSGRVLFLPVFPDETGTIRGEIAQALVDATRQVQVSPEARAEPYWARTLAVPGLEQEEAAAEEATKTLDAAKARFDAASERLEELKGYRRLITEDGPSLAGAVRDAFALLGFTIMSGSGADALQVEDEGRLAFVESEGSREDVVEWPYVRLQRRLEQRLFAEGDSPHGIIVANGMRTVAPEDRENQFTLQLRIACENYRYTLVTGETLFALVQRALGNADAGFLTGARRRLMSRIGLLSREEALGEVEASEESGTALF